MQAELVERAQQGDKEAFAALTRAVADRCMAIAFRILRDTDLAEDAVQATLIKAWHQLPRLRDRDRFDSWLNKSLVNACYSELRRQRRHPADVIALTPDSGHTVEDVLTVDDRDQLERGFRRLSADQRAILVFHHFLGLTLTEVSEQLGIPLGTAKSRLRYASAALRAALEADSRVVESYGERPA